MLDMSSLLVRRKVRYVGLSSPLPMGVYTRLPNTYVLCPGHIATAENECGMITTVGVSAHGRYAPWTLRSGIGEYQILFNGEMTYKPYQDPPYHWDIGRGFMVGYAHLFYPFPPIPAEEYPVKQLPKQGSPVMYVPPETRVEIQVRPMWPIRFVAFHINLVMALFYLTDLEKAVRPKLVKVSVPRRSE